MATKIQDTDQELRNKQDKVQAGMIHIGEMVQEVINSGGRVSDMVMDTENRGISAKETFRKQKPSESASSCCCVVF